MGWGDGEEEVRTGYYNEAREERSLILLGFPREKSLLIPGHAKHVGHLFFSQ